MKFYIDFDCTLFDTTTFKEDLKKILENHGLDKNLLKPTVEASKSRGAELLNLRRLFNNISQNNNISSEILLSELDNLMNQCNKYLYNDSVSFLEYLKSNGDEIILLTWGDKEYQNEKVKKSRIDQFFDNEIYTGELKYTLDLDYNNSTFIDDSVKDLKGYFNNNAKRVIRIRRENGKYSQMDIEEKGIEEYSSLRDLQKKLEIENNM